MSSPAPFVERLSRELSRLEAKALVVVARSARDPDLALFSGPVHLHQALVVASPAGVRLGYWSPMERDEAAATGHPLLTPEELELPRLLREGVAEEEALASVLGKALQLSGLSPGRVALAGHPAGGTLVVAGRRLEAEGWELVPGHSALRRLRKPKDERALAEVRRVAAGTVEAFRAVAELLAGTTVRAGELRLGGAPLHLHRLRRKIAEVIAAAGLEQPEGSIVAAGEEAAVPHTAGDPKRVLRPGETLIVDLYPCAGAFADCTRTFCVGEPPADVQRAHAAVREALELAHRLAVPGADGWHLQQEICEHFVASGYETPVSHPGTVRGYVHGLGHGVGLELHELPSFRQHAAPEDGTLEVGDVLTLEPGLYDVEQGYGVRLEDLVALGTEGAELLTPLPYDLDPRCW